MTTSGAWAFEGKPFGPIQLQDVVEEICLGQEIFRHPEHSLQLDDALNVALSWNRGILDDDPLMSVRDDEIFVRFPGGDPCEFLQTRSRMDLVAGTVSCELTPVSEPLIVGSSPSKSAEGILINGSELVRAKSGSITFDTAELIITVTAFAHAAEVFSTRWRHAPPALTHHVKVEGKDRELHGHTLIQEGLGRLVSFLGFVKGSRVGVGQFYGKTSEGAPAFSILGFTKSDRLRGPSGWYYSSLASELPRLFERYLLAVQSPSGKRNFGRAANYYKASNTAQADSTEIGLLISMAGLEALACHVLQESGGWTPDLLKKATLADMLRAMARFLSIQDDPIQHSKPLQSWVKAASKGDDGFNVLAEFRNGLTHSVPKFRYDGHMLLHAWFASQWLLEVAILALLGYRGKYQDRRRQEGSWRGTLYDMPLAQP